MVSIAQAINDFVGGLPPTMRDLLAQACACSVDGDPIRVTLPDSPADGGASVPEGRRRAALAVIKKIRGAETVADYVTSSTNPYRDDDSLIDIYVDDQGNEYWFDVQTADLVQMGPAAGGHTSPHAARPTGRLPVKELRDRAITLASSLIPDFAVRKSSLHPLEDNRRGVTYFFRWDDFTSPVRESELPPFVQVALYADGSVVGYTNTLRS